MAKDIKRHIQLLKSSGATEPDAADLLYGEIAVGYGKDNEALYIKNSNDQVVTFGTSAAAIAIAENYADSGDVASVTGDTEISVSLSPKAASGRTLTITHASGSAQSGFKKLSSDAYGHITGGTNVALSDLTGLGALSGVSGEQGITASTKANGVQTLGHSNKITAGTANGSSGNLSFGGTIDIPSVTYDANGHITASGKTTVTLPSETEQFITSIENTSDINLDATSGKLTATHVNSIAAGSAKTSSTSVTATPSGANIAIPVVAYDANGHISGTDSTNVSLKVNTAATGTAGVVKIATATGNNNTDTVMTQSAVTAALAEKALASSAITNAEYDSTNKLIKFTNAAGTQVDSIDTTDFIKDGMVNNAEISGTNLVITFNTDAGKDPISIPLSSIFDPSNYYTKSETSGNTEISTALNAKANTATTVTGTGALGGGGNLGSNQTITHNTNGTLSSGTTSPNEAQTPSFGGTFNVPVLSYDSYGHITASTTSTVTIPASAATWSRNYFITGATTTTAVNKFDVALSGNNASAKASFTIPSATTTAAGVMTSDMVTKLNGIAEGATNVTETTVSGWGFTKNDGTVKSVELASGTNNGTLKLTVDGTATDNIAVKGLGSAAYTDSSAYAASSHTHTASDITDIGTYANQNAFSNVKVGSATIAADTTQDTVEFAAAENSGISISADTTNDKVTFDLGDIICGDYA